MAKIVLDEGEIKAIKEYFAGEITACGATEDQQIRFMRVIDKATALQKEIDPEYKGQFAEEDCDLIRWFWKEYIKQEGIVE